MMNPYRGEVGLVVNGTCHPMRLSLGALAALEHELGAADFTELLARFDHKKMTTQDVIIVLHVGLIAGGSWCGTRADLCDAVLDDGLLAATRSAARLFWVALTMEPVDAEL